MSGLDGPGDVQRLRAELAQAQRRIQQLETSTSMRLGRTLVGAARNPRSTLTLPREMRAMWRGRRAGGSAKAARSVEPGSAPDSARILLADLAFRPEARPGPVVAGVVRDATAADLAGAGLVPLLPHSAVEMLDRVQPDLVLVESAAAVAPSPWAHLGDPAAADRVLALDRIRTWAAGAQVPVVFWRTSPAHLATFLEPFARGCDAVVGGPEGQGQPVPPAVALRGRVTWGGPRRGSVTRGGADPAHGPARTALRGAALAAVAADLTVLADPDAPPAPAPAVPIRRADVPGTLGGFALGIANPFGAPSGGLGGHAETWGLLAAGLRTVTGPDPALAGMPGVLTLAAVAEARDLAAEAVARGPLSPAEHAAVLRHLHLHHAPAARLAALAALVRGGPAATPRAEVSVLAWTDLGPVVEAVSAQVLPPAEVVVRRSSWQAEAARRAEQAGVRVAVVPDDVDPAAASARPAVVSGPLPDPNTLLDLEIVAAATGATRTGLDRAPDTTRTAPSSIGAPTVRWDLPA